MAGEVSKQIDSSVLWGGGHRSPFSVSYGKMMMWFFLVSDALTFSGLLVSYAFFRHKFEAWPSAEDVFKALPFLEGDFPLIYVALMTFILIVSSVTMVLAVEAGHRMDKKAVIKWMVLTVLGGVAFLGSQAWEWSHFIHGIDGVHATLTHNPYGPRQYAQLFFFITGFHGFHVFSGVVINFIVMIGVMKGVYHKRGHYEMVEKAGLYWHFVDLVWVFVFTFFYLV